MPQLAPSPRARILLAAACALALRGAPVAAAPDSAVARAPAAAQLDALRAEFRRQTGAELVFREDGMGGGDWYDRMPELAVSRRIAAARILIAEARAYPAGWLGAIGLRRVGVFAALVSEHGDGFRPFDATARGYLYYGLWNGADALVAAYYTDGQLPLTFHHEVFHHVDATAGGAPDHARNFTADDAAFAAAIDGRRRYPGLSLAAADLKALARRAGAPLDGAVGDYAAKAPGEDQAETARWLMSHLATGLWQAAARPELPGSQRILHVLAGYGAAGSIAAPGPDAAWLVDVALGRDPARRRAARTNPYLAKVDAAIDDAAWRAAIRAAQPATVRLGGGSGVNLAVDGLVLTAAHVVDEVGATLDVRFPDGTRARGTVTHKDATHDLALVALAGVRGLPVAAIAAAAPSPGDAVAVVGQPGTRSPDGEATGYQPWHVSTGHIRGFRAGDRGGEQSLGRTKHDAWTYWGHSGSPLFDRDGAIVALHNSWDAKTAMRHAVTWEAIVEFLERSRVTYTRP